MKIPEFHFVYFSVSSVTVRGTGWFTFRGIKCSEAFKQGRYFWVGVVRADFVEKDGIELGFEIGLEFWYVDMKNKRQKWK